MELQKLSGWSFHRQYLDRASTDIMEVLRSVPGIYSTHPSGPLSLHVRVPDFNPNIFESLETNSTFVRTPGMRESVFIFPNDTARTYRSATLPLPDDPSWAKRYSKSGRKIPKDKYPLWVREILAYAEKPRSSKQISVACDIPGETIKPVLNRMAFEGRLLRINTGSLRSNKLSYVNSKTWAAWEGPLPSVDHAQLWLVHKYFKSFGPARLADFFWWSGIKKSNFKWKIEDLELAPLENGYYISSDLHIDYANWDEEIQNIAILPQWDPYTMGYAPNGRSRLVEDNHLSDLYGKIGATGGNAKPCILINGRVEAIWKLKFKSNQMEVVIFPFGTVNNKIKDAIASAFDQISGIMNANKIHINWS